MEEEWLNFLSRRGEILVGDMAGGYWGIDLVIVYFLLCLSPLYPKPFLTVVWLISILVRVGISFYHGGDCGSGFSCEGSKTLHDFSMALYMENWEIIRENLLKVFNFFLWGKHYWRGHEQNLYHFFTNQKPTFIRMSEKNIAKAQKEIKRKNAKPKVGVQNCRK